MTLTSHPACPFWALITNLSSGERSPHAFPALLSLLTPSHNRVPHILFPFDGLGTLAVCYESLVPLPRGSATTGLSGSYHPRESSDIAHSLRTRIIQLRPSCLRLLWLHVLIRRCERHSTIIGRPVHLSFDCILVSLPGFAGSISSFSRGSFYLAFSLTGPGFSYSLCSRTYLTLSGYGSPLQPRIPWSAISCYTTLRALFLYRFRCAPVVWALTSGVRNSSLRVAHQCTASHSCVTLPLSAAPLLRGFDVILLCSSQFFGDTFRNSSLIGVFVLLALICLARATSQRIGIFPFGSR